MKDEAGKAVHQKIKGVESEQGMAQEAGAKPNSNFGHGSASSAGVSGSIPVHDAFGEGNSGGGKKMKY